MKILLVNDYGVEIGGAETYLKNLKRALKDQGHDVRVLTSKSPDGIPTFSDYTFQGLNVNSPFRLIPYMFNVDAYKKLKHILKEFNPDIVHLHFTFYHTSPSVLLALNNVPTVMTTHAHEIIAPVGVDYSPRCNHPFIGYCIKCTGPLKYFPEIIKRLFFRIFSKRINLFIAPSNYYADIHKKAGYSPVVTVYNGIEEKNDMKARNQNHQNILYVGRLAPEKGAEFPIRALPHIHKKFPEATVTIVGDGPERNNLKQLIKQLDLQDYVTLTGKVSNEETAAYYQNASLVVVPSTYPDNLPTVCIEAMNYGRALLVSNIGGLPELVRNGYNGYLFTPGSYHEIASKTIALFEDKKNLQRITDNSRKMITQFSMQTHMKKLVIQYESVIHNYD